MTERSMRLSAWLTAACIATLPACAHSPATRGDPVIETRVETRRVCPAEVTAPVPAQPATPAGAVIDASRAVLAWIGKRFAREELLARRLLDAKAQCP